MFTDRSAAMRAKALDYLAAGRVTVTEANDTTGIFVAAVHGEASYTVFRGSAAGLWHCDCPAGLHGRPCSHAAAVALVSP